MITSRWCKIYILHINEDVYQYSTRIYYFPRSGRVVVVVLVVEEYDFTVLPVVVLYDYRMRSVKDMIETS